MELYSIILFILLLGSLFLPDSNKIALITFVFMASLFNWVGTYIPDESGLLYYFGAGLTSFGVMFILARWVTPTKFVVRLYDACLIFIVINFSGWILYELYISSQLYTSLCTLAYAYILYLTVNYGDKGRVGVDTVASWHRGLFRLNLSGSFAQVSHEEQRRA